MLCGAVGWGPQSFCAARADECELDEMTYGQVQEGRAVSPGPVSWNIHIGKIVHDTSKVPRVC